MQNEGYARRVYVYIQNKTKLTSMHESILSHVSSHNDVYPSFLSDGRQCCSRPGRKEGLCVAKRFSQLFTVHLYERFNFKLLLEQGHVIFS